MTADLEFNATQDRRWRVLWRLLLGLACLPLLAASASAGGDYYIVQIRQPDQTDIKPAIFLCREDFRRLCHARILLLIDGQVEPVEITGKFSAGDIYLRFRDVHGPIFVGARPFVHIPAGGDRMVRETIVLTEPTPTAIDDANGISRRPVQSNIFWARARRRGAYDRPHQFVTFGSLRFQCGRGSLRRIGVENWGRSKVSGRL